MQHRANLEHQPYFISDKPKVHKIHNQRFLGKLAKPQKGGWP
jgi:hypothetical protein